MADTTYTDFTIPSVNAAWLNDINISVYRAIGKNGIAPTTPAQVVANLGFAANQQPPFGYVSNPGIVVNSTASGNIVETRSVTTGIIVANLNVEATVRAFINGTNNTKTMVVGLSPDAEASALTAVFTAGQSGIVTVTSTFVVSNTIAGPHLLISRADFGSGFGLGGTKRATITFNPNTTAFSLVTKAWVANSADSITIDSIEWRVKGGGL